MEEKICLLVTTFNRDSQLKNSLERLTKLTLPKELEILIVNDGGNDYTETLVESFKDRLPIRYIYNHNPEWSICSYARNIGIKNTDAEWIFTIEPELLAISDFIPIMLDKAKENPNHVITAGCIFHGGESSQTTQLIIDDPTKYLNDLKRQGLITLNDAGTIPNDLRGYNKTVGWVAPFCALYKKDWLMKINGWCEDFILWGYEDISLLERLTKIGINQIIYYDIEFIHQWHEKLPPDVQYRAVQHNEALARSRVYEGENNDIKANKNKDWGIIKTR